VLTHDDKAKHILFAFRLKENHRWSRAEMFRKDDSHGLVSRFREEDFNRDWTSSALNSNGKGTRCTLTNELRESHEKKKKRKKKKKKKKEQRIKSVHPILKYILVHANVYRIQQ